LPWNRVPGRIGIHEFLQVTSELSNMLLKRAPESKLVEIARAQGMRTLREECLSLVLEGETTLEEVLRVTGASTRPATERVDERRRRRDAR
jgi:type II secretory ATPase GspE/PulE/Tfp pilus assembly ATPase PilB-like protein